jgi:hypothetical protein
MKIVHPLKLEKWSQFPHQHFLLLLWKTRYRVMFTDSERFNIAPAHIALDREREIDGAARTFPWSNIHCFSNDLAELACDNATHVDQAIGIFTIDLEENSPGQQLSLSQ